MVLPVSERPQRLSTSPPNHKDTLWMELKLEASSIPLISCSLNNPKSRCELPEFERPIFRPYSGNIFVQYYKNAFNSKSTVCLTAFKDVSFQFGHVIELVVRFSFTSMKTIHSCNVLSAPNERQNIGSTWNIVFTSTHGLVPLIRNFDRNETAEIIDSPAKFASVLFCVNQLVIHASFLATILFSFLFGNEDDRCYIVFDKTYRKRKPGPTASLSVSKTSAISKLTKQ